MDIHDIKNFNLLVNYINNGDVLIDVGANQGDYTDFFKQQLNNSGKIYSAEIHPDTYTKLSDKYNGDENIVLLNKAISNVDGTIPFYESHNHCLHNILGHDVHYNQNNKMGEIESIRLDTLLKHEEKIKLIKIDVEGAELLVLDGIKNIIDKVEYILVECHLENDWDKIKTLLLDKYNMTCINNSADISSNEEITHNSKLAYQCFCGKNKN